MGRYDPGLYAVLYNCDFSNVKLESQGKEIPLLVWEKFCRPCFEGSNFTLIRWISSSFFISLALSLPAFGPLSMSSYSSRFCSHSLYKLLNSSACRRDVGVEVRVGCWGAGAFLCLLCTMVSPLFLLSFRKISTS